MVGADRDVVVVVLERLVDLDQRLLLGFGDAGVAQYLADQVVLAGALFEDASPHVEGLGGDAQRLGDLLEDLGRGLAQPALDLAEVGVADATRRCSRMNSPRSCMRASNWSFTSVTG
jgi:hypothetical protein